MTAITDKELRDELMKEKTLGQKKTIELIKQNTYETNNTKKTIPEPLISTREKHVIKEEPIQRMERFGARPKLDRQETYHADFAEHQFGHHYTDTQQQK